MEQIRQILKSIVEDQGEKNLRREPCQAYHRLLDAGAEKPVARLILISWMADAAEKARELDAGALSAYLQQECFLRKRTADRLAAMYQELFPRPEPTDWEEYEKSLQDFCRRTWKFAWTGKGEWEEPDGICKVDCSLAADLTVEDTELVRKVLQSPWKKRSIASGRDCFLFLRRKLTARLEAALREFIQEQEEYPPYLEDYDEEFAEVILAFCAEHGLRSSGFEYEGHTGNIEWSPTWF